MTSLDLDAFAAAAARRRAEFAAAAPFPHVVLDGFLRPEIAAAVHREFDGITGGWTYLHHVNEKKRILGDVDRMGAATRALVEELGSAAFVRALETLTGLDGLRPDPALDGAGLAEMDAGGFLNVHRDFLAHTTRASWSRQVNLLVFLNPEWPPDYGGDLELWDASVSACVRSIAPVMNRCVIFRTGETSFHGVPGGVRCPAGRGTPLPRAVLLSRRGCGALPRSDTLRGAARRRRGTPRADPSRHVGDPRLLVDQASHTDRRCLGEPHTAPLLSRRTWSLGARRPRW